MNFNSDYCSLDDWAKDHAHKNVFEHDGKIIDCENAFRAAGLHVQASPSYEDWLKSR